MKFMKLGTRPDTFFTTEATRSVSSEVSTDIRIQVHNTLYLLHKFPLLSKCARLQSICSNSKAAESSAVSVELPDIPGGSEAFETCAKFCYGITITVSPLNFVPVRLAAGYLQMHDAADRGNLAGKLDAFFAGCILRRWRDTLLTLQATRQYPPLCEELGITGRCVDALSAAVAARPSRPEWSAGGERRPAGWWAEEISELGIDHFWRVMLAVRSAVPPEILGEAVQIYAFRWLPILSRAQAPTENSPEIALKHRTLLEKIVSLLPLEKGSVPCGFLLKLLKAANILKASSFTKTELTRRAGVQLDEAAVGDLLIPSLSDDSSGTLYDVELVMSLVEEFMLQGRQSPPAAAGASPPPRGEVGRRRRSRSAENVEFEAGVEGGRRSSSASGVASHGAKLRVARLVDGYLMEIARDGNLGVAEVVALAEAVPGFARTEHDDLYRVVDTYLRAHPDLDKSERKQLCRILDCKKLSIEACMHAAQNELLPLRVVVQVLFFEQARAAMSGRQVTDLPNNIKALLARRAAINDGKDSSTRAPHLSADSPMGDHWSISGLKCPPSKLATLRMKLEEDDNGIDDDDDADADYLHHTGLLRSSSSRFRALCSIPSKPKRIISKLWSMNRSVSERH